MKGKKNKIKKYYAYIAKDMVGYFENEAARHGVNIINRELINDGELYYYVVEAKDGIINPKFEM